MDDGRVFFPNPEDGEESRKVQAALAGRFGVALGMSHETGPSRLTPEALGTEPVTNEDREKYHGIWGESSAQGDD